MVVAVVLDGDHSFRPAQIEVCDRKSVDAEHGYLRLRAREARVDEQQTQVALPG